MTDCYSRIASLFILSWLFGDHSNVFGSCVINMYWKFIFSHIEIHRFFIPVRTKRAVLSTIFICWYSCLSFFSPQLKKTSGWIWNFIRIVGVKHADVLLQPTGRIKKSTGWFSLFSLKTFRKPLYLACKQPISRFVC